MLPIIAAVQLLHILGAIFWFGASMLIHLFLLPSLKRMPAASRLEFFQAFGARYRGVIPVVGGLTILLGVIRGLLSGVLGSVSTPYGLTWIGALVLALVAASIGARLTAPAVRTAIAAAPGTDISPMLDRVGRFGRIELGLLCVILPMMVAMHFGY